MLGQRPTLRVGHFYRLPDNSTVEVLRVSTCSATARNTATRKSMEISPWSEIQETEPQTTIKKRDKKMTAKKTAKLKAFGKYSGMPFCRWLGVQTVSGKPVSSEEAEHVIHQFGLKVKLISIKLGLFEGRSPRWSKKHGIPELTKTETTSAHTMVRKARKELAAVKAAEKKTAKVKATPKKKAGSLKGKGVATRHIKPITKEDQLRSKPKARAKKTTTRASA